MSYIKSDEDIAILREVGKRHAEILVTLSEAVRPDMKTGELEELAQDLLKEYGDEGAFMNYQPEGASFPYPASLCVSVNEEIVHGIPGDRIIRDGDIVSLDFGVKRQGLITDAAVSVVVGKGSGEVTELLNATREALYVGIRVARAGSHVGDIGYAIGNYIKDFPYGLIRELGGHGVGHKVHEDPYIANYGQPGRGMKLKPGMVLALEPMFTLGSPRIVVRDDGYTIASVDESWSAHFEHTILITDGDPEVLTQLPDEEIL